MNDEPRRPRPASDRGGQPEPVRPRNVRDGMPGEGTPPEIEIEERVLELDGSRWTVRAVGRARMRAGAGGTPLIQLAFRRAEADSADGDEREALAVGRTLAELPDARIAEAFANARSPRPDRDPAPFFDGTRQTGGRGRG